MTDDEIIQRLQAEPNLKRVSDESGIPYSSLHRWKSGETRNPGMLGIGQLRSYYEAKSAAS